MLKKTPKCRYFVFINLYAFVLSIRGKFYVRILTYVPLKIQLVQELKPNDYRARCVFAGWTHLDLLKNVAENWADQMDHVTRSRTRYMPDIIFRLLQQKNHANNISVLYQHFQFSSSWKTPSICLYILERSLAQGKHILSIFHTKKKFHVRQVNGESS